MDPVRTKIVVTDKKVEQIRHFRYIGSDTSYDQENDVHNKQKQLQIILEPLAELSKVR